MIQKIIAIAEAANPLKYLPWLGLGGSLLGVASLLWAESENPGGQNLRCTRLVAAAILSAASTVIVMLGLWNYLAAENVWLLLAVSLLAGVGGASTLDFLGGMLRQIAVKVTSKDG